MGGQSIPSILLPDIILVPNTSWLKALVMFEVWRVAASWGLIGKLDRVSPILRG